MNLARIVIGEIKCRRQMFLKRRKKSLELKILKSVIESNMRGVYGRDMTDRRIASLVHRNLTNHEISAGFLEYWPFKTASQTIEWSGFKEFEEAVRKHSAVIVCSIHFGNYYLFPFETARLGYKTVVVVGDQHKQFDIILTIASSLGLPIEVLKTGNTSLLRLIRELEGGKVVYILIDEVGGAAGNEKLLHVPFLGKTLQFRKGVGALHYYSGAPVIPVVAKIMGRNRSIISVGQQLECRHLCSDRQSRIDDTVLCLFRSFEKVVRDDPAQWQKWVDLKRYTAGRFRKKGAGREIDVKKTSLRISRKRLRLFRDHSGYVLVDMREGRYFALNEIEQHTTKLMYKRDTFDAVASRIQKKFDLSENAATDYIKKIASIGLKTG